MKTLNQYIGKPDALSEDEVQEMWEEYISERDEEQKKKLLTHYLWIVRFVTKRMTLPSHSVLSHEDFLSIGIIGLSECIDRFSLDRGVKFETYAMARVRGTIQDEMRKMDWLSRSARKKATDFTNATDEILANGNNELTQEAVMKKLKISSQEYKKYLFAAEAAKSSVTLNESAMGKQESDESSILENMPEEEEDSLIYNLEKNERDKYIKSFIQGLKEKPRLVITLYYFEELTFKEIGMVLNVSESRISQIHSQVIKDLKEAVNEFNNS